MIPRPRLHRESSPLLTTGEQAKPGDQVSGALSDLISRFDGFIRRTAARHGLTGSDLDDVVQDLQIRIWKSLGTADLIRRAKPAYLHRAAVSASLDLIRSRRSTLARASRVDDTPPGALIDHRSSAMDDKLAGDDLARAVHSCLAELHESRRAVVRMYLAGYDRFEIAALMGWTEGKTRNLLYRGLEDLRSVLRARGISPHDT